jgi:hypothetical protein
MIIKKNLEDFLVNNQMSWSLLGNGVIFITSPRKDGELLRHIAVAIAFILDSNKNLIHATNFTMFLDDGSYTTLTFTAKERLFEKK